jgi:hypothetical protein
MLLLTSMVCFRPEIVCAVPFSLGRNAARLKL